MEVRAALDNRKPEGRESESDAADRALEDFQDLFGKSEPPTRPPPHPLTQNVATAC